MKRISEMLPTGVRYFSNRADAETAGIKLLPYDPKRQVQKWTARADGSYDPYGFIDKSAKPLTLHPALPPVSLASNPLMEAFLGPQGVAFGLNIPGPTKWVDWSMWMLSRASSAVTVTLSLFGGDRVAPVGKDALYSITEAGAFAKEFGGTAVEATDWNGQKAVYTYPDNEKRRVWTIQKDGMLLAMSNAFKGRTEGAGHGIGSPGHWNVGDGGSTWISEAADLGEGATTEVPPPAVDLAPDEEVAMVMLSGVPTLVVRRKGEGEARPPVGMSSGLTIAQDAKLQEILVAVKFLVERTGG